MMKTITENPTPIPQLPTFVVKKRKSTLPWSAVPIKKSLNGEENDRDSSQNAVFGKGLFGSLRNEQDEIQLSIDKNQRLFERNLRIKNYSCKNEGSNVIDERQYMDKNEIVSSSSNVSKIIPVLSKLKAGNKILQKNEKVKKSEKNTEFLFEEKIMEKKNGFVFYFYFLLYGLFLGSFIFLTTLSTQLSQFYLGVNNYPLTASIIRELAVFLPGKNEKDHFMKTRKVLKNSKYGYALSNQDQNIEANLVIELIRIELDELRGCGDALFISSGKADISKSCPHHVHKTLNNNRNENLNISKESQYDSSDVVNNNFYENFIHNNNLAKDRPTLLSQNRASNSYLSAAILQPLGDSPTLSSTLSWEFNTNFFKYKLIFNDKKSEKFKIFLDIRMDNIRLNFPGGNLFNVEVSTDIDQPLQMSVNMSEHGLLPGIHSIKIQVRKK